MKFFAGFITSVVIIALTLTGIYVYKELKPVDKEQPQQTEKVEDSATTQQKHKNSHNKIRHKTLNEVSQISSTYKVNMTG